ncbi:15-hydroxyprostaglandin dehydrogenase [NAD(+)]-like isoform X1 [Hemiscyllium ocellatum]|uniref:15-hydroxyprostaglandin dehydrogenase [NAD(+)]-like isoform X1 n=1 Tax=Hemiscyllium ocellatum TaxID=170820 RepID=UPI0029669800|nr:15-hydroxyprostaglandin dehydrogenase [NAD(+)]-like isoform X1 [Hemiscyllium ocellatum]
MILKNCVGLITGASQGLGKAFAESLLKKGAQVVICDINQAQGEITRAEFDLRYGPERTAFITCDVTSLPQLKDVFSQTVQTFGRLDVLCNNAGINNENSWERTISVNLVALIQASYLALDHMRRDRGGKGGSIINVASMSGFVPAAHAPVYTASKHGVLGFTRSLAEASSLGNYGVRINALCPSFVNTEILETVNHEENLGIFYQFKDNVKNLMQVFGVLEPSDIANGFVQLLEDDNLNGAVMKITTTKGIHFENY